MIKNFSMFSGYGGDEFSLNKAEIDHECVGFSEIDKYADKCFKQNHGDIKNFGDCREIDPGSIENFDLLTGGFPCQAFSVAGKGLGEHDTRGTLFYDIIRIAAAKKPKVMLLENVKGLTNKNHKDTFYKILSELDRIGYFVSYKVLNSREHGIPHSRQRVFFVCFRKDLYRSFDLFKFPEKEELKIFLQDILEDDFKADRGVSLTITANYFKGSNVKSYFDKSKNQIVFDIKNKGIVPIEENRAYMIGNLSRYSMPSVRVPYAKNKGIAWALGTSINQAVYKNSEFRKLTPKECFRLMGFLKDEINLEGLSNTQRYKLAGNGWDINLVSKIFKKIQETGVFRE